MKKICTLFAAITLSGTLVPVVAQASQPISSTEDFLVEQDTLNNELVHYENTNDMINDVEPFVYVNAYGELSLKDTIPQALFEKYQLDQLLEHFNYINQELKEDNVVINDDLTIEEVGNGPLAARAVHGRWTRRWWGFERNFNNSQANVFRNRLTDFSLLATTTKGVTKKIPPVAALSGLTSRYLTLMSSRVAANNRGRGVYVGITFAAVFNMRPL